MGVKDFAPAAERNREPIREILASVLPAAGVVLEVASGSGQHVVHFARAFPGLTWQPSDVDGHARQSVQAWVAEAGLGNIRPPLALDASADTWPIDAADAVVCINMIHIAPWACCLGLLDGAARLLSDGAPLVLYGPYTIGGSYNAESNARFDEQLRRTDPAWGLRDLRDVEREATTRSLRLERTVDMPANNYAVIFRRRY